MKIICNEYEKKAILRAMFYTRSCVIASECPNAGKSCMECLENNIEWEVTEDAKDDKRDS